MTQTKQQIAWAQRARRRYWRQYANRSRNATDPTAVVCAECGEGPFTPAGNRNHFAKVHRADLGRCYFGHTWDALNIRRYVRRGVPSVECRACALARHRLRSADKARTAGKTYIPRRSRYQTTCGRGHDITVDGALKARGRCRLCANEAAQRRRDEVRAKATAFDALMEAM